MEQIVFPVPGICQFLTEETKHRLFTTTEQDEQGSKVSDFFDQSSFLHNEMEWQRKLRSETRGREGGAVWSCSLTPCYNGLPCLPVGALRPPPPHPKEALFHVWLPPERVPACKGQRVLTRALQQLAVALLRHAADLLVLPPHDPVGQHLLQPGRVYQHHHCLLLPLHGGCVHR